MSVNAWSDELPPTVRSEPIASVVPTTALFALSVPAASVVTVPLVARKLFANKFVEVVFVPVPFVQIRFENVVGVVPVIVRFCAVRFVIDAFDANKFVLEAMLENKLVVVALPNVEELKVAEFASNVEASSVPAFNVATVPEVPWKLVTKRSVVVTWFKVALVALKICRAVLPETFRFVALSVAMEPLVAWKFVANKAVLVVFMPVPFTQYRELKEPVPPFRVVMVPEVPVNDVNARAVVVTLLAETLPSVDVPLTFNVPVAVRLSVWIPPSA